MQSKNVRALASLLLVLSMALTGVTALADDDDDSDGSKARLVSKIEYTYVGYKQQFDEEGRLLVWESSIEGDVTGEIKWWMDLTIPDMGSAFLGGTVNYYAARWEIRNDGNLLLAGDSAGKTVWPDGEDGIWDGHGVVTDADGRFDGLKSRKMYETGPVIFVGMPFSLSGTGMFVIY